jgi:hypothetical protein
MVDLTDCAGWDQDSDNDVVKQLEDRLTRLEKSMLAQANKNVTNDLMLARSREETDFGTNKIKEDRLVINGLKSNAPLPTDQRSKIEALKKIADDIFEVRIPNYQGKIIYLSQGKSSGDPIPMVEVCLDSVEAALAVRKAYAEKIKCFVSKNVKSLEMMYSIILSSILTYKSKPIKNSENHEFTRIYELISDKQSISLDHSKITLISY